MTLTKASRCLQSGAVRALTRCVVFASVSDAVASWDHGGAPDIPNARAAFVRFARGRSWDLEDATVGLAPYRSDLVS